MLQSGIQVVARSPIRLKVRLATKSINEIRMILLGLLGQGKIVIENVNPVGTTILSQEEKVDRIAVRRPEFTLSVEADNAAEVAAALALIGWVKFYGERWSDPFGATSAPRSGARKGDYANRQAVSPAGELRQHVALAAKSIEDARRRQDPGDQSFLMEVCRRYGLDGPPVIGGRPKTSKALCRSVHASYLGHPHVG